MEGADVILATSNSYKVASDPLKGLRPDGRLILIANPVEAFNIPSPSEFIANRLQIMASVQSGGGYLYEELSNSPKPLQG
jgi:alcohol dehydrogenase